MYETRPGRESCNVPAGGQVAGVQRMVEEDRYCIAVLTQIAPPGRFLR